MNSLDMILKMAGLNPDDVKQQILNAGNMLDRFTAQLNRIEKKQDLILTHNGIIIPDDLNSEKGDNHDSSRGITKIDEQVERCDAGTA